MVFQLRRRVGAASGGARRFRRQPLATARDADYLALPSGDLRLSILDPRYSILGPQPWRLGLPGKPPNLDRISQFSSAPVFQLGARKPVPRFGPSGGCYLRPAPGGLARHRFVVRADSVR